MPAPLLHLVVVAIAAWSNHGQGPIPTTCVVYLYLHHASRRWFTFCVVLWESEWEPLIPKTVFQSGPGLLDSQIGSILFLGLNKCNLLGVCVSLRSYQPPPPLSNLCCYSGGAAKDVCVSGWVRIKMILSLVLMLNGSVKSPCYCL